MKEQFITAIKPCWSACVCYLVEVDIHVKEGAGRERCQSKIGGELPAKIRGERRLLPNNHRRSEVIPVTRRILKTQRPGIHSCSRIIRNWPRLHAAGRSGIGIAPALHGW